MSQTPAKFQLPIKYLLLPLLIAILVFAFYLMNYLGAFKPVIIAEKSAGPFIMLYKKHTGPYHEINKVISEVETWAKQNDLDCKLSFGEYLDNPKETEEGRLRSNGGCLISTNVENLPDGFELKTIPVRNYITALFEGSPGIGPMKVYSRVYEYAEENRKALAEEVIEVYEIHSAEAMTTTYYFPLKNQN